MSCRMATTLTEAELRQTSRGINSLIPINAQSLDNKCVESLGLLLERLFLTAEEPRLSASYRAASCDALCGFFEQVAASSIVGLQKELLSPTTLARAFNVYIQRSRDAQAKPMKHLLKVLVGLLVKDTAAEPITLLVQEIASNCLWIIYVQDDSSCAKAAMQVLGIFIQKNLIYASFVLIVGLGLLSKNITGEERNLTDFIVASGCDSKNPELTKDHVPVFVSKVMEWLQHADTASAAGRLLVIVLGSLQKEVRPSEPTSTSATRISGWVSSVLDAVRQQPNLAESLEQHLLPSLLRLDASENEDFLQALSIDKIVNGDVSGLSEATVRLCLIAVTVIEELETSAILRDVSEIACVQGVTATQYISLHLLVHSSASVRVAALKSFTYAPSTVTPLPAQVLRTLQQRLPEYHAETDARARNELHTIIKKFLSRLAIVIRRLSRAQGGSQEDRPQTNHYLSSSSINDDRSLRDHTEFLGWYVDFLVQELQPTASYPRHISALKILKFLADNGLCSNLESILAVSLTARSKDPLFSELYSIPAMQVLLDLCMDAFDDVRSAAVTLLSVFPYPMLVAFTGSESATEYIKASTKGTQPGSRLMLSSILRRAESLMRRTGRADYADGVGRLYDLTYLWCGELERNQRCDTPTLDILENLLTGLEDDVRTAQNDLQAATSSAPVHGRFIALRYIVSRKAFAKLSGLNTQQSRQIHDRLVNCCLSIWNSVKDVLCYDSPEGHVIAETEDEETYENVKDTLSFCWRALKEASALVNAMISNPFYLSFYGEDASGYEDLRLLGNLTLIQLAELRHRGAFSTVSQTFAACCVRCAASKVPVIAGLPSVWYQETLSCIEAKASALTRRSAGLPAMITGILSAHPDSIVFDNPILDLQTIASTQVVLAADQIETRLPQVHALNCLKDIFTNSRLGPATEPHLATTLTIAVNCLENNVWAIRNCGLMLLKALLTRLVGGASISPIKQHQNRRNSSKLTYAKYPVLADLVVGLLHKKGKADEESGVTNEHMSGTSMQPVETVFPAMEVIERVGVPVDHEELVMSLLMAQLGSPVWILREKAAKVLGHIHNSQVILDDICGLLQNQEPSQNALHGRLLCLKVIVCDRPRHSWNDADYMALFQPLAALFDNLVLLKSCPVTASTYLDILNRVIENILIRSDADDSSFTTVQLVSEEVTYSSLSQHAEALSKKLASKWAVIFRGGLSQTNILGRRIMDPLVSALARTRILLSIFKGVTTSGESAVLDVLCSLGEAGDIALTAGIQCFNDNWGISRLSIYDAIVLYIDILKSTLGVTSKVPVMEGLTNLLCSYGGSAELIENLGTPKHINLKKYLVELMDLEVYETSSSPEVANAALTLYGALLASVSEQDSSEYPELHRKLNIWTDMLNLACDEGSASPPNTTSCLAQVADNESQNISTRLAAVSSLDHFKAALRPYPSKASSSPIYLNVYLAVYDTLVDDDEDVRNKGAAMLSWILSTPTSSHDLASTGSLSLSAVAAAERLLEFLKSSYKESRPLFQECLCRMTGINMKLPDGQVISHGVPVEPNALGSMKSVKDLLALAMKENTSLFVEEKQNLYIDPVQESRRWTAVLIALSPEAISRLAAIALEGWVLEGLECLIDVAAKEEGGPLGWTSKPEVFTLGMQVLATTSVVLKLHRMGLIPPARTLSDLLQSFKQAELHPIWRRNVPEE